MNRTFPVNIFTGRTISCTGPTVYEGDPANVTCHYNSDLSVTHDSFYIARWRPGHYHHRKASYHSDLCLLLLSLFKTSW